MLDALAESLTDADAVAVADIWAGRDPDTTIASSSALANAIRARAPNLEVLAPGPVEATADRLATEVRSGDVVLVLGGGNSYRIATRLLGRLAERP
jgi:UDP-N-acetylmuramate-alanine ligase